VEFVWLSAPEAFLGNGRVQAVRALRMHLGVPDATGRQTPRVIEGSSFTVDCDTAIEALGFDPEDMAGLFGTDAPTVTRWGTIKIDFRTMMTSMDGVFAAGDIARGASLVVWAIRDGRDAAAEIHKYITAKDAARDRPAVQAVA
ncbi:MAG: FAD-dependent oxidoreductase, partial [Proteobacteria bacterium]|nr:FAD-dependent oxidoreductase [Pseudomonadota bacterium]